MIRRYFTVRGPRTSRTFASVWDAVGARARDTEPWAEVWLVQLLERQKDTVQRRESMVVDRRGRFQDVGWELLTDGERESLEELRNLEDPGQ